MAVRRPEARVSEVGLVEQISQAGLVRHAYRVRTRPDDTYRTACGRQMAQGTTRGVSWRDLGPSDQLATATCPECRARLTGWGLLDA